VTTDDSMAFPKLIPTWASKKNSALIKNNSGVNRYNMMLKYVVHD
jgi:hypothetical protein